MSTIVERVGKAIFKAVSECETVSEMWNDAAKAAIEAMREPTIEMVAVAYDNADGSHIWREVWKAMIDAALKE